MRAAFSGAYYASCFIFSSHILASDLCWQKIREIQSAQIWIGESPLCAGGWMVKLLADDSVSLHRGLITIQAFLAAALRSSDADPFTSIYSSRYTPAEEK